MPFNVKHGGIVRYSLPLSSSESTSFKKGHVMRMDTSGELLTHDGSGGATVPLTGISVENRVVNQTGVTTSVVKTGAPTGNKYSIVIDEAVIIDDQIRSGITFAIGDVVYTDTAGKLTTSGNGTGTNAPRLGRALSTGSSGDSARPLEFYFSMSY